MFGGKARLISLELQQIKAYKLSQQRLLDVRESNFDDWNEAKEYLAKHQMKELVWKLKKRTHYSIKEEVGV